MNIQLYRCPNCSSDKTEYDRAYGYSKCLDCLHIWGFDKDDPDYDDLNSDYDDLDDLLDTPKPTA